MPDPTIRAALEAAKRAMRQHGLGATREEVAEAVAAFLRALPAGPLPTGKWLAAAVEEASRDV